VDDVVHNRLRCSGSHGEELRKQAGVIPFRGSGKKLEICLIRRKGSKKWGIPKGFIERGDTSQDAALQEALEEAGLKGRLIGEAVGSYEYRKWRTTLDVTVYLMEVQDQEDDWDEADIRDRQWTSFEDAEGKLEQHPVRALMEAARERLS
jgi:8-oxo-dGTP pyrophosphatase MutT (NUDIX family)